MTVQYWRQENLRKFAYEFKILCFCWLFWCVSIMMELYHSLSITNFTLDIVVVVVVVDVDVITILGTTIILFNTLRKCHDALYNFTPEMKFAGKSAMWFKIVTYTYRMWLTIFLSILINVCLFSQNNLSIFSFVFFCFEWFSWEQSMKMCYYFTSRIRKEKH